MIQVFMYLMKNKAALPLHMRLEKTVNGSDTREIIC